MTVGHTVPVPAGAAERAVSASPELQSHGDISSSQDQQQCAKLSLLLYFWHSLHSIVRTGSFHMETRVGFTDESHL